jgi:predicted HTH transcriptional regulator
MNYKEIKELIAQGESTTLEFKRKIISPVKLAKELAAFANTKGGNLLIGVDDDGTIVGIDSEKSAIELVNQVCEFFVDPPLEPRIEIVNVSWHDVLVVQIDESRHKPHYLPQDEDGTEQKLSQRRVYIRVGEKSLIASREMARLLKVQGDDSKPLTLSIGDKEKRLFLYLEHHERATVKDFARLVNISDRRAERLLIRLVRAGVIQIHVDNTSDYFTLV